MGASMATQCGDLAKIVVLNTEEAHAGAADRCRAVEPSPGNTGGEPLVRPDLRRSSPDQETSPFVSTTSNALRRFFVATRLLPDHTRPTNRYWRESAPSTGLPNHMWR